MNLFLYTAAPKWGSVTAIGNDCALLAQAHVAHNCQVGNHVVMSHSATLAGHVVVGDHANIGGLAAVHQFCQIGPVAMVAGMARVVQDVLPYTIAEGFPAHMRVVNKVGLERAGFSAQKIKEIRKAFRILFTRDLRLEEAVAEVRKERSVNPMRSKPCWTPLSARNGDSRGPIPQPLK